MVGVQENNGSTPRRVPLSFLNDLVALAAVASVYNGKSSSRDISEYLERMLSYSPRHYAHSEWRPPGMRKFYNAPSLYRSPDVVKRKQYRRARFREGAL